MKKITVYIVFVLLYISTSSLEARRYDYQFGLPLACHDSWDAPSWWVDDYNARICQPGEYTRGHDFGNLSECSPKYSEVGGVV